MSTGRIASRFLIVAAVALNAVGQSPPNTQALQGIKRICVDKFAGDDASVAQAREVAIASLFALKRFAVTENCDKADASLRGAIVEKLDQRTRAEGEGAAIGKSAGAASGSRSGFSAAVGSVAAGSDESLFSSETKRQASVTLRITNKDGDVLWAYSYDSPGGKVRSAVSDAVDRAVRQLAKELEKTPEPRTDKVK